MNFCPDYTKNMDTYVPFIKIKEKDPTQQQDEAPANEFANSSAFMQIENDVIEVEPEEDDEQPENQDEELEKLALQQLQANQLEAGSDHEGEQQFDATAAQKVNNPEEQPNLKVPLNISDDGPKKKGKGNSSAVLDKIKKIKK